MFTLDVFSDILLGAVDRATTACFDYRNHRLLWLLRCALSVRHRPNSKVFLFVFLHLTPRFVSPDGISPFPLGLLRARR